MLSFPIGWGMGFLVLQGEKNRHEFHKNRMKRSLTGVFCGHRGKGVFFEYGE